MLQLTDVTQSGFEHTLSFCRALTQPTRCLIRRPCQVCEEVKVIGGLAARCLCVYNITQVAPGECNCVYDCDGGRVAAVTCYSWVQALVD